MSCGCKPTRLEPRQSSQQVKEAVVVALGHKAARVSISALWGQDGGRMCNTAVSTSNTMANKTGHIDESRQGLLVGKEHVRQGQCWNSLKGLLMNACKVIHFLSLPIYTYRKHIMSWAQLFFIGTHALQFSIIDLRGW